MKKINLDFIKTKRENLGISLQQMAHHLGFKNASTYLKYEKGVYAFKAEHLPILAEVLKCDLRDFFTFDVAVLAT
jgi:transcriptional regulator with XRE-family HTH domain